MKKLTQADLTRINGYAGDLKDAWEKVKDAKAGLQAEIDKINEAIDAYNEIAEEARSHIEDHVGAMDAYLSERSEKWLEGDAGSAYESWKSEFENLSGDDQSVDHVDMEAFEFPDEPELAGLLENLPESPQ